MPKRFKQWLIVAVLVADGVGLAAYGWSRVSSVQTLLDRGVTTEGKVIDHATSHSPKRSRSYSLQVEFAPTNSGTITKTLNVDGGTYNSAVKGGTVMVRYLPDNPNTCAAGKTAILPFQVMLVLGLGMFGSGLLLTWFIRRI